jgi:hypothetical protein
MSELPLLERALRDAAERRYDRPWWRPAVRRGAATAVLVALAAATAVVVVVSLLDDSGPAGTGERPAARPVDRWTATLNEAHGFEVSLPPGWRLSEASLTPQLLDPRELLSAGTFPLRYRKGSCSHMPTGALKRMGPADGFVSIQERGGGRNSGTAGFPARPGSFVERARPESTDLSLCLDVEPHPITYWMPFSDAGRRFYALLVLGRDAPASTRAEAFAILDRIRFDPAVKPDWDSTP